MKANKERIDTLGDTKQFISANETREIHIPESAFKELEKKQSNNGGIWLICILCCMVSIVATFIVSNKKLIDEKWQAYIDDGYISTVDAFATSGDIMAGKSVYVNGEFVIGTYEPIDHTASNVTASSMLEGYSGYNNGTRVVGSIKVYKGDIFFFPTNIDVTIKKGQYLSEFITVVGDVDLISENIKKGVTIFGVEGSLE